MSILNLVRMLSRSAVVKLKVILIIDLIIVGAAVGVYFYLQEQGVITGAAKPADFIFSDLVVSPLETYVGQPIQISVNVTNIGDVEGETTVNLEVNGAVRDSMNLTLAGLKTSEIVEFTVIEMYAGSYNVTIEDLSESFRLKEAPPESSKVVLSNFKADPYEAWPDEPVLITAIATNPSTESDRLLVSMSVDDVIIEAKFIEIVAGASIPVEFSVTVSAEGRHTVKLNALSGSFTVVPKGYHTLTVSRSGGGSTSLPFTLNGEKYGTSFTALLPEGQYTITVPDPFDVGTGVLGFSNWHDGSRNPTLTFTLDKRMVIVATYNLISGYASCPSLYIWNGTGYSYVTDVSNAGWLGYIGSINSNGEIIFSGGNPYDYVKLDKNVLVAKDGYFDITLSQQWDELFYLDSASLLVVDHPIGTDVYTSMTNYLNKGSTGQIYTTATGQLLSPVSAINEQGQDVLDAILWQDNNYTPGINGLASPAWNNIIQNQLTLNLGDLSEASQIKLVLTGMVDWGPIDTYYDWIAQFQEAAAAGLILEDAQIMLAPTLEVLDANGTWIMAPQTRQIPLPSDYNARTFTVDLTGLFPPDITDYMVRLTNFWNVTYDYIGIDTTLQQDIVITTIKPSSAVLSQLWETLSESTGAFTRYGDVTELMQDTDDMFVIGRQGDQVNFQFCIDGLSELSEGMERDYFFVVACWFKDPPGAWGYGFTFTVDPLPFLNMTGFPYTNAESYLYDTTHLDYINKYNTRIIT
ncbi:hypothetical protein [Candidatus Bathycorpusculum sp.]|uniref:hypothetical protein n=1 Tax=Candidatus Bathycorpusculum sp. TaxID=2994959 RepID=UPI002816D5F7|nr:hypothetical protein [Candidatus Termitimicrobium sp.]MCL2431990.1 hypothetical protein [Candidatus Termitimicrobium sp.]